MLSLNLQPEFPNSSKHFQIERNNSRTQGFSTKIKGWIARIKALDVRALIYLKTLYIVVTYLQRIDEEKIPPKLRIAPTIC